MLLDGKRASSLTANRQLSDRQWAKIQEHLRLPDHARDDFEKIVARHLKGIAARERECERAPGINSPESIAVAAYFADHLPQAGMVVARKRGIKSIYPHGARLDLCRAPLKPAR
jgi:hypothetical protein